MPLLKRLVRQNVGIGFLTRIAINPDDRLATLAIDDAHQPAFTISIVHRKDRVLTPAMKRFESILKSYKWGNAAQKKIDSSKYVRIDLYFEFFPNVDAK